MCDIEVGVVAGAAGVVEQRSDRRLPKTSPGVSSIPTTDRLRAKRELFIFLMDFDFKAKARIWPWLFYMCDIETGGVASAGRAVEQRRGRLPTSSVRYDRHIQIYSLFMNLGKITQEYVPL